MFSLRPFIYSNGFDDDDDLDRPVILVRSAAPQKRKQPQRKTTQSRNQGGRLRESHVEHTDKGFQIFVNLQHYRPEEVKITHDGQKITICAEHEEQEDNYGYVSRKTTRVYNLPEDVEMESVTSTMNQQGILSITGTKRKQEVPAETPIPVQFIN